MYLIPPAYIKGPKSSPNPGAQIQPKSAGCLPPPLLTFAFTFSSCKCGHVHGRLVASLLHHKCNAWRPSSGAGSRCLPARSVAMAVYVLHARPDVPPGSLPWSNFWRHTSRQNCSGEASSRVFTSEKGYARAASTHLRTA